MAICPINGKLRFGFAIDRAKHEHLADAAYPVILIFEGVSGYSEGTQAEELPTHIEESAITASMFGWNTKAAQPAAEYAATQIEAHRHQTQARGQTISL